ncbi:MAG: alcohol dehydrogenase catalytic domain-containing protein, partial [Nitrososphaerales archaeon]
ERRMPICDIPDTMLAWPLYGAGIENFGVNGRPARWTTPRPAPDQILVRSDAVGLCYSDVKVIRQGSGHPRLYNRDLACHPVVQGHEVTMTVAEVGEAWRDRFEPGQRFVLQADIYYRGKNLAYGYVFVGGLAQYSLLGPAALDGDEGCYAIPVPAEMGYAEVALTEPWACVEAAYVPRRRLHIKKDGVLWVIGRPGLDREYRLGESLCCGLPKRVIGTDIPQSLAEQFTWPPVECRDGVSPDDFKALTEAEAPGGFDDIIVLDPTPEVLDALPAVLAPGALVNLVGERPLGRPVQIDAGRVHYDYTVYVGTRGPDVSGAYGETRNRAEVRPGGVAWIIGGGGPMGRMHLQRMLEMNDGPRRILVSESNAIRNPELLADFGPLAQARGIELSVLSPRQMATDEYEASVQAFEGAAGFDDIVVIVASVPAIEAAMPHLAPDGMLQVFGGLARGTLAQLDLSKVYLGGAQITGSAGSTIHDQASVLGKVHVGQLSTAAAVAAIGGIDAARDGMLGLMEGRFPGKMVIYPQVESFPLTALADLKSAAPKVYDLLGPRGAWSREAEAEFLRTYAGHAYE